MDHFNYRKLIKEFYEKFPIGLFTNNISCDNDGCTLTYALPELNIVFNVAIFSPNVDDLVQSVRLLLINKLKSKLAYCEIEVECLEKYIKKLNQLERRKENGTK